MNSIKLWFNKIVTTVDSHKWVGDAITAVLLAFVPILQHYKGLIDNAGTTVLAILLPYLFIRFIPCLKTFKLSDLKPVMFLLAFFLYKMIDHGTYFGEIAQVCLMTIYLTLVCKKCINTAVLVRIASLIAGLAGAILILQYFCYYVFDFHLRMVPTSLLLPESDAWVLGALTGRGSITGKLGKLYRPSAFFLEPSHLFMYSFPLLFITLFSAKNYKENRIIAIFITIGMILCTSGMGIAVAAGAWGLYFALGNKDYTSFSLRNILQKRNLILIGSFVGAFILAVICVPFLRESVVRIFSNPNGSTAISGRTERALRALKKMDFGQWIIGVSDSTASLSFNMPGFMATAYKYGIIGIVLSYVFYVKGLFKLNMPYFWATVILLVVSFFSAHTHGTFFMLFYVLMLFEGYRVSEKPWIFEFVNLFKPLWNKAKKQR